MKCDVCGSSKGVEELLEIQSSENVKKLCSTCMSELTDFTTKIRNVQISVLKEENTKIMDKYFKLMQERSEKND